MSIKYRFTINGSEVYPIYKDDVSLEYEIESEQRFFRKKITGKFRFIKEDYDLINNAAFDTEFVFSIIYSTSFGIYYTSYANGSFYKTNCKFDDDNKIVETSMDIKDSYTNVLAGINNEYDLIKLAAAKTRLTYDKRPLLQLYVLGEDKVSNFLSGDYWEQDCDIITDASDIVNVYKFALGDSIAKITISASGTVLPSELLGEYTYSVDAYYNLAGTYKIVKLTEQDGCQGSGDGYYWSVIRVSDSQEMFYCNADCSVPESTALIPTIGSGSSGYPQLVREHIKIYSRYLLDVATFNGSATVAIPSPDIVADNKNYSKVSPYSFTDLQLQNETTTTPTEYGLATNDEYYVAPVESGKRFFPIARSTWNIISAWFVYDQADYDIEATGRKPYVLKDAMFISDVIKVLLAEIDNTITHEATNVYSEFLYDTINPLANLFFRVMITQKTNVTLGEYDKPAQKAVITLGQVFEMLKNTFECYWYIDNNKLKIEHISWFKNGGSYAGTPLYTADLTTLKSPRNNKTWGLYSSNYEYEKSKLQERFEFSWMDEVASGFTGYPIKINSKFVQRGNLETISVSKFTSDIDYMLLSPNEINKDGFALFAAVGNNLFDINDVNNNLGKICNYATGVLQTYAPINATDYIPVEAGGEYTFTKRYMWAWYNSSKVFISGSYTGLNQDYTLTAPANAAYVIMSVFLDDWTSLTMIEVDNILEYSLPYINKKIGNTNLRLQNGLMSWLYLHPNFWIYDLPSTDVDINDEAFTPASVQGVKRTKLQNVSYPSIYDPDPMKLVKTYLGDGEIEKISVNLSSRMNKIALRYDTE